jgi:hypothetical protein
MREIKFRGRDEHGRWHFGDLLSWPLIRSFNGWKYEYKEVAVETVGQYTGLKDCKGREIYEGDIIKTHEGDVGVIVWETELGGFRARLTDDSFYTLTALFASMFSVIGNVHDNLELLEVRSE